MITAMQFIPQAPKQEGEIRRCLVNHRVVDGGGGATGTWVPYPILVHDLLRLDSKIPFPIQGF